MAPCLVQVCSSRNGGIAHPSCAIRQELATALCKIPKFQPLVQVLAAHPHVFQLELWRFASVRISISISIDPKSW